MGRSSESVAEREKYKSKLVRLLGECPFMPDRRKVQLLSDCGISIIAGKTQYELLYDALMGDQEIFKRLKHWVDSSFKSKKKNYMEARDKQSYDIHISVVDGPVSCSGEREKIRIALEELDTMNAAEPELELLVDLVLQSGAQLTQENNIELDFDRLDDETVWEIGKILQRLALEELDTMNAAEPELELLVDLVLQSGAQLTQENNIELDFDRLDDETVWEIGKILQRLGQFTALCDCTHGS
ncbi:hypothetical protein SUGI_0897740 [Cryptomeria japonica]|nr:hypothetical protein SUGI_0897740 [Cryptomeria japonica]